MSSTTTSPVLLAKYSLGVGDRFGQQAVAQLQACQLAAAQGIELVPVWNKSNREHLIVGSEPAGVMAAAAAAVQTLGWRKPWHVDADHIRRDTVDRFIPHADFYTLDVADAIGQPAAPEAVAVFVKRHPELIGELAIPGVSAVAKVSRDELERIARKYLVAVEEAGRIHRRVEERKGPGQFITEVSLDETDSAQSPRELLIILAALADEHIPAQTIAPKFTGRFNKGVDYAGDVAQFEREFSDDLSVIAHAVERYGLPANLKLSVHSGSDKFSIYGPIRRALERHNAGLHLKTAGTTWLEEVIGLAEAGGEALALVKEIFAEAIRRLAELCAPYATVIDIDPSRLPSPGVMAHWTGAQLAAAIRHEPNGPEYNPSVRQLFHVAYKLAAQRQAHYLELVRRHRDLIAPSVTANLFHRHVQPIFSKGFASSLPNHS